MAKLKMEKKTAIRKFRNDVYKVVVKIFEELEHNEQFRGSSHHAAQNIAQKAVDELQSRWRWDDTNP